MLCGRAFAQSKFDLQIIAVSGEMPNDVSKFSQFKTPGERYSALQELQGLMYKRGYLAFSIDSITESGSRQFAFVSTGLPFKWAALGKGNLDGEVLGSIKFKDKLFYHRDINPKQVSTLFESILEHCENNGYPFAQVRFDSIEYKEGGITAVLDLDKNRMVKIDSVLIKGSSKTTANYFHQYLGLKPGMLYNESAIRLSETRIKELPFATTFRPTEVIFTEKSTKIQLFLNHKKASRFDGIIGFQPNEETGKI